MQTRAIGRFFVALAAATGCHAPADRRPFTVAAASDLTAAFGEIGGAFAAKTNVHPTISFGSTGLLAKQLTQGAPYDVFAAANESYVEQAVAAGACDGATKSLYARGRLVVWWPASVAAPPAALADLADPRFVHVAIANPEHAPYGRAAEQALARAGVLDAVRPKLVFGENVRQTLQSAETGNADVAIVALSLAIGDEKGAYLPVEQRFHDPIDQAMVVCRHGQNAELGKEFVDFVASKPGRAIMQRYGFLLPGESLAAGP
ncbi:MAG TPA: molybdate ABC transporter substrate-binding protein [Polyangiaceae bacterium]|nr:molybdate ABC transporter substrate-binding protein [Polyangiaceae bacterium]